MKITGYILEETEVSNAIINIIKRLKIRMMN